ncbi:MAG: hypothetical protein AAGA67_14610 [Cyanobacteria bacterium P01_F01_bin.153]
MSVSAKSTSKQQFSVLLDPKLIEEVMKYTDTPGDAVEDGLRLWLAQQKGETESSQVELQATTTMPKGAERSPAMRPPRRRPSVIPSPQDYPPLAKPRSQTGAITPAAKGRSLDLAPSSPPSAAPESGQLRKAFSRPNMPHRDQIPPRRRIDHLPVDERRSSNDDETGWLV